MCSRDSQRTVLGRERRGWQRGAVADQIEILSRSLGLLHGKNETDDASPLPPLKSSADLWICCTGERGSQEHEAPAR